MGKFSKRKHHRGGVKKRNSILQRLIDIEREKIATSPPIQEDSTSPSYDPITNEERETWDPESFNIEYLNSPQPPNAIEAITDAERENMYLATVEEE